MDEQLDRELVQGAFWLSAAGVISRVLGLGYRIPLNRFFGPEIMGMYQMIHPIYQLLIIISTAGFPTAVSRMVSREKAVSGEGDVDRVFMTALMLLGVLGALLSLTLFLGSDFYASRIIMDERLGLPLRFIAPAVFFVFLSTVYRGFFQGIQNMFPFALSQVVEQLFRVGFALALAFLFMRSAPNITVSGITAGTTIGALCGLVVLIIFYVKDRPLFTEDVKARLPKLDRFKATSKEMLGYALPITLGGMMTALMRIIDVAVVTRRLALIEGITTKQVQALYGYLTSYAGTVTNLPIVFAISLAASVVPAASKLYSLEDEEKLVNTLHTSLKIALILGAASTLGLLLFSREINLFLYADDNATVPLQIRALGVLFISLSQVAVGALHGLGEIKAPLLSLFAGLLVQFVLTFFLTPIPQLNINGAAIGRVVGSGTSMVLNLRFLRQFVPKLRLSRSLLGKVGVGLLAMGMGSTGIYGLLYHLTASLALSLLVAIASAAAIYFFVLSHVGVISRQEVQAIPRYGDEIADILFTRKE